jgi:hypothetical protein
MSIIILAAEQVWVIMNVYIHRVQVKDRGQRILGNEDQPYHNYHHPYKISLQILLLQPE